ARGIDIITAPSNVLHMSAAQVAAVLGTGADFAAAVTVTLSDTGAAIAALSSTQFGQMTAAGVDKIDASDDALTLTLAQYGALGSVQLTTGDTVTIQDDHNFLNAMSVSQIKGLSAAGIDVIRSVSLQQNFTWNVAQADAFVNQTGGGTVAIGSTD